MRRLPLALLPLFVLIWIPAAAQPSGSIIVKSTVHDADPDLTNTAPFGIKSDGGGDYVHRPRYLDSLVQSGGDWVLDVGVFTTKPSGREVFVEAPGLATDLLAAHLITRCRDGGVAGHNQNISEMSFVLQSVRCGLSVEWKGSDGLTYRIYFNQNRSTADAPSEDVDVICLAVNAGRCASWRVRPSTLLTLSDGRSGYHSIGKMVKLIPNKKGGPTEQLVGTASFSFLFDFVQQ